MVRKALIKTRVHGVRLCLVHPRVGDMGDYVAQLCSGVWCQVSGVRCQQPNSTRCVGVAHQMDFISPVLVFSCIPISVQDKD
jgi:hypothetical protein